MGLRFNGEAFALQGAVIISLPFSVYFQRETGLQYAFPVFQAAFAGGAGIAVEFPVAHDQPVLFVHCPDASVGVFDQCA